MRVLIVGCMTDGTLEGSYYRSLSKILRSGVDFFDTSLPDSASHAKASMNRIVNRLKLLSARLKIQRQCGNYLRRNSRKYDVILFFKGAEFSRDWLESHRIFQPDAIWANLNPDDPLSVERGSSNSRIRESLSFFDLYITWTPQLTSKLIKAGCKRVECLPFGYDPDWHVPPVPDIEPKEHFISFIGAWDKQRQAALEELSVFDLKVYGNSWQRLSTHSPLASRIVTRNIYRNELANIIFHSVVSLNLLRPQNISSHNMRTFEIPAMGGLMLATRSQEQQVYFPENQACLMFDNGIELREQLCKLIREPGLRKKLRAESRRLVQSHSYAQRAKQLISMVNQYERTSFR